MQWGVAPVYFSLTLLLASCALSLLYKYASLLHGLQIPVTRLTHPCYAAYGSLLHGCIVYLIA